MAWENLQRLRKAHRDGTATRWLDRWEEILAAGPDAVFEALTSPAGWAVELRQTVRSLVC
jgi:hypothetical protein